MNTLNFLFSSYTYASRTNVCSWIQRIWQEIILLVIIQLLLVAIDISIFANILEYNLSNWAEFLRDITGYVWY